MLTSERGDQYFEDLAMASLGGLYRCRSLLDAGIPLGAGTDAPFGNPDPWLAMAAAVHRQTRSGRVLGPDETLTPETALQLFTSAPEDPGGPPRRIEPGTAADFCLLDQPWQAARERLESARVRMTIRAGEIIWQRS